MADGELGNLRRAPRVIEHRVQKGARYRTEGMAGGQFDAVVPVDVTDAVTVMGDNASSDGGGTVPDWFYEFTTVTASAATTWALTYFPVDYSEIIRLNGITLAEGLDYTIAGNIVTWISVPDLLRGIGTATWRVDATYPYYDQAGEDNISPPGTPYLWLKADSLSLADGTAVASWPDSSANAYSVTQATGANQPIFKTNILNGLPVLRFNGTSQQFDSNAPTPGGSFSIFAVFNPSAKGTNSTLMGGLNNGSPNLYVDPATDLLAVYDTGVGVDSQTNAPVVRGAWNSAANRAEHVTSTYDWVLNGVAAGSGTAVGTTWFTTHTIGVGWTPSPAYDWFKGDLAELIVYNTFVSDTDRDDTVAYLKAKWGV